MHRWSVLSRKVHTKGGVQQKKSFTIKKTGGRCKEGKRRQVKKWEKKKNLLSHGRGKCTPPQQEKTGAKKIRVAGLEKECEGRNPGGRAKGPLPILK